jgi:hypothetical protein
MNNNLSKKLCKTLKYFQGCVYLGVLVLFSVGAPAVANANTITANTGGAAYSVLFDNTQPGVTPRTASIVSTLPGSFSTLAGTNWIGPSSTESLKSTGGSTNLTTYSTTLNLTGLNLNTASLAMSVVADGVAVVALNGKNIEVFGASPQASNATSFTIATPADFISGINTISFQIYNFGDTATGLDAAVALTASPIITTSEPSSLLLVGLGLIGVCVSQLQRRKEADITHPV